MGSLRNKPEIASPTGDRAPIRVVLADDHAVLRAGIRAELGERFTVVGEADNAEAAIDVINAHTPDLVVSDLHMPGGEAWPWCGLLPPDARS